MLDASSFLSFFSNRNNFSWTLLNSIQFYGKSNVFLLCQEPPKNLEPQEGPKSSVLRMIFNSNYQYFGSPNDWDLEGTIKSQQIKESLHNFDIILFSLSLLDSQGALKSQSGLKFGVLKR